MGCLHSKGKPAFRPFKHQYEYDLIVIGGGSAGLACAREAAKLGALVALCDYVTPTPRGTSWGLGGTCVNVGCIPKKLMHQSNLIKDSLKDASLFGWSGSDPGSVNWDDLVRNVQDYIFNLNIDYRIAISEDRIRYYNGLGSFIDNHKIKITYPDLEQPETQEISGQCIVIAVGGRPNYLKGIPGGSAKDNFCITSDDLFSLPYPPGNTVVVGAGYIGVECAGFLAGFGFDVTMFVRSTLLREFDQMTVDFVTSNLIARGVTIRKGTQPVEITLVKDGAPPTLKVAYKSQECVHSPGGYCEMEVNTILLAVGRRPNTATLNLDAVPKVKVDEEGYIITDVTERTGVANIYAIGDCAAGRPKLTPAAVQAGRWLARRIFDFKNFSRLVDYSAVATTIFSPVEYGCCGLSEEEAVKLFGEEKIEVYHKSASPLEFGLNQRDSEACYARIICLRKRKRKKKQRKGRIEKEKKRQVWKKFEKVIGFHYFGPFAAEITQGFAMAVKRKAYRGEFLETIGIHPSCAEMFCDMMVPKGEEEEVKEQKC